MSLVLNVDATPGTNINEAARDACALAAKLQVTVRLDLNATRVYALPASDPAEVAADWRQAREGMAL